MGRDEATSTRNLEDRLLEFNKMGRSLKITILGKQKSRLRTYLSEVDKEEGQCSGTDGDAISLARQQRHS
jgi:hypothetical protein